MSKHPLTKTLFLLSIWAMPVAPARTSFNHSHALFAIVVLFLDPLVSNSQPFVQRRIRFPIKDFANECIVAVAPRNTPRCAQVVFTLEFYPGNFFNFGDEIV